MIHGHQADFFNFSLLEIILFSAVFLETVRAFWRQ